MADDTPNTEKCDCVHDDLEWRKYVTEQIISHGEDIKTVKSDTAELVEILKAVKGGLRVLGALGHLFKYLSGLAVAAGALWAVFHGKWPSN